MRSVIFTPAARAETIQAQDWYDDESPGLGERFESAVDDILQRIRENPRQFPIVRKDIRRALLHRFPFALMFILRGDERVTVIACFHGSRNPARWRLRT
jgi:plasmid stabilization system protein ParE